MKYATALLIALLSAGITITVMQQQSKDEIETVRVDEFNSGWMDGYKDGKAGF